MIITGYPETKLIVIIAGAMDQYFSHSSSSSIDWLFLDHGTRCVDCRNVSYHVFGVSKCLEIGAEVSRVS